MSTEQLPSGLENAQWFCVHAHLSGFAGAKDATEAHDAIRAEHAQRLKLQHHAADQAQRVADLERQNSTYKAAWSGYHPLADYMRGLSDAGNLPGMLGEHFGDIAIKRMQAQDERVADLEAEVAAVRAHVIADEGDLPRVDTAQSVAAIVEQRDWLIESVRRTELERDQLRARLAEIEAQEPVATFAGSVDLFDSQQLVIDRCGNSTFTRGQALFSRPVPAQSVPDADGARLRWLSEDHSDRETRERCRSLIDRLPGMSYSAAVMSIDAAMAAAPEHKA